MGKSTGRSEELFQRALARIPGGVNSPVRAFGAVGGVPRFMERAEGSHIWDEDGAEYIDFVGSWGPMLLGHNHPVIREAVKEACGKGLSFGTATRAEVEMAELMCDMVPSLEMVRMVNSGTEAVMSAIRVARGYTGRSRIIKFRGCYHGHSDGLLVKAGSGALSAQLPDSAGVSASVVGDTLLADYNDPESVRILFDTYPGEIGALIVEPVAANMGVVPPQEGFLQELRILCDKNGALLIFDEVITGFRLGAGGAQEYFGVRPDLTTFGKIIGGGMPVGAYGGRRDIMEMVAPLGPVYQAGTLSGNPVAMAAGLAQLGLLKEHPEYYESMEESAAYFFGEIEKILREEGQESAVLNHVGTLGSIFFTASPVKDYRTALTMDRERYGRYFHHMLERGVYLAPAGFEAMFLSAAHTRRDLEHTLTCIREFMSKERL